MKFSVFIVGLFLSVSAQAQTANLWIDTTGGTCTRSGSPATYVDAAACSSMQTALAACTPGDTIRMKAGTYGAQTITAILTTPGCTIIAETTTTVGLLTTDGAWYEIQNIVNTTGGWTVGDVAGANHITCRGCSFDGNDGIDFGTVGSGSGVIWSDISWIGGTLKNFSTTTGACGVCVRTRGDQTSSANSASNLLIDGVTFDNVKNTGGDVNHFEVIRVDGNINGITIRNSTFNSNDDVSTALIFFTTFLGDKPDNVLLENNFMDMTSNQPWLVQMNFQTAATCQNFTYRYNTFKQAVGFDATSGHCSGNVFTNFVWLGNIIQRGDCSGANTFNYNLGFGASGSACSGTGNGVATAAAMNFDTDGFHILSGSAAIGAAGSGANCIATDHDGNSRSSPCDAGAIQFTAGTTPNAPSNLRLISWLGLTGIIGLLLGAMHAYRTRSGGGGDAYARSAASGTPNHGVGCVTPASLAEKVS